MSNNLKRANTITITNHNDGWDAHFSLTHKKYDPIHSGDTGYQPNPAHNVTLQREFFRQYMVDNAEKFGILWDPTDRRTADNMMPARYDNDQILVDTAKRVITQDIVPWLFKISPDLSLSALEADEILGVTEYNGRKVSPKYANGAWGWAKVTMTATVTLGDVVTYVQVPILIVSGQMKKPGRLGDNSYTMTGLKTELSQDIESLRKAEDEVETEMVVGE